MYNRTQAFVAWHFLPDLRQYLYQEFHSAQRHQHRFDRSFPQGAQPTTRNTILIVATHARRVAAATPEQFDPYLIEAAYVEDILQKL